MLCAHAWCLAQYLEEGGEADAGVCAAAALPHAPLARLLLKALLQALQHSIVVLSVLKMACNSKREWSYSSCGCTS